MPTYRSGDPSPGGADFRRLARDAARHAVREAGFGLAVERGPTTDTFRVAKGRAFWARLTGRGGVRYSWQEVWPTPAGGWSNSPESRTGELNAFERNRYTEITTGSEGGIVWLEPGDEGDWRFTWNRAGGTDDDDDPGPAPCNGRVCVVAVQICPGEEQPNSTCNGFIDHTTRLPLPGAEVTITGGPAPGVETTGVTDESGHLCFAVPAGNGYVVTIRREGSEDESSNVNVGTTCETVTFVLESTRLYPATLNATLEGPVETMGPGGGGEFELGYIDETCFGGGGGGLVKRVRYGTSFVSGASFHCWDTTESCVHGGIFYSYSVPGPAIPFARTEITLTFTSVVLGGDLCNAAQMGVFISVQNIYPEVNTCVPPGSRRPPGICPGPCGSRFRNNAPTGLTGRLWGCWNPCGAGIEGVLSMSRSGMVAWDHGFGCRAEWSATVTN